MNPLFYIHNNKCERRGWYGENITGDISVMKKAHDDLGIKKSPGGLSYVLVADGEIIHKNLEALGLDEAFVWETIQDLGMEDLSQIDVLEMSEDGSIYLNKKKNL